jgi:hypothetical protein
VIVDEEEDVYTLISSFPFSSGLTNNARTPASNG